jgi:3-methyl-2-oxobutanoate hydroxymethyltransferase
MKPSIENICRKKSRNEKITMLTSYDFPTACMEDLCGIDIQLVGDSLGTNVLGYTGVEEVTLADMLHHAKAVRRGAKRSFVLCDMPYGSYATPELAVENARFLRDGGVDGVKMEGETAVLPMIRRVVGEGITVCGHIGYTPQTDGDRATVQGKTFERAIELIRVAREIEAAGAALIVLELIPEELAGIITRGLTIPTIGIGAGRLCDGQVQVIHDILGLSTRIYRHAKAYDTLSARYSDVISAYISEVQHGLFPTDKNVALLPDDVRAQIVAWIERHPSRELTDGL